MIRIGLVDFDTSHVVAFTQRMNHLEVEAAQWVEGAKVVAGCPGASDIMPERIPGYTDQLKGYGIAIVRDPKELIGKVDAIMIESVQGSKHLERARPFLEAGLPTFVDKPFANSVEDADAILALARKHKALLMSCSALRFDPKVRDALAQRDKLGAILSADVWTSASLHPGNPGLLHYGIHGVEILYTLLGGGCKWVQQMGSDAGEVATGLWTSGHVGTVRGLRLGQGGFGFAAHYEKGHVTTTIEGADFYREMLKAFVKMVETGTEPIDAAEMREIIAFCVVAERSRIHGGTRSPLP